MVQNNNNNNDYLLTILEKYENDIAEIIVDGFMSKDENILNWVKRLNNYYESLSSLKYEINNNFPEPPQKINNDNSSSSKKHYNKKNGGKNKKQ